MEHKESIICFPHCPAEEGGPGTFQINFENYLKKNAFSVTYPDTNIKPDIIFIVAGTRKIFWLFKMKLKGVKILHRLDGMNWKYDFENLSYSSKIRQILQNYLIAFIRRYLATHVVYQSLFIEKWWNKRYGLIKNSSIVVNGSPFYDGTKATHNEHEDIHLTCIEGAIQNDKVTRMILSYLNDNLHKIKGVNFIEIFGNNDDFNKSKKLENIVFRGALPRSKMKENLNTKKRIFFLLELNPPCPNSMIEALCLGIPCVGFNSGSFDELLSGAGIAIPYDGDVWKLEPPKLDRLVESINAVSDNYEEYSKKALSISTRYDVNLMNKNYLKIIHKLVS